MDDDRKPNPGDDEMFFPDEKTASQAETKQGMFGRILKSLRRSGEAPSPEVHTKTLQETEKFFDNVLQRKPGENLTPEELRQFEEWSGTDPETGEMWHVLVNPTPVSSSGGMSEVFLGLDIKGQRKVALKVPRREGYYRAHQKSNPGNIGATIQLSGEPTNPEQAKFYLEANMREADAIRRSMSKFIVPLYGSFEREQAGGKQLVLVLEYLSPDHYITGSEAVTHYKDSPQQAWLEVTDALSFIAFGLNDSFDNGKIIHLDIKPGNFFLPISKQAYIPRLADFGAAAVVGRPDLSVMAGSYPFVPPEFSAFKSTAELFEHFDQHGHESAQVYALAASLANMLGIGFMGQPELSTKEITAFCNRVNTSKELGLNARALKQVFATALALEPWERYQTIGEFLTELRNCET
jgi:serine/threonine protein kinase